MTQAKKYSVRLNKTFIFSFIGSNAVAAVIAFVVNTWVNITFDVDFISQYTYSLAMSTFVFTIIDFGRVNDLLLRNIDSKKSVLQNIMLAVSLAVLGYFFSLFSFGILTLVVLTSVQRYLLNYSVLLESKILTWCYQIIGSLLRMILVLILTYRCDFRKSEVLLVISVLLLFFFIYSGGRQLLSKSAVNIGILNIGLIIVERFDVIILNDYLNETDYASLSAILSYSFLIGIFADPITKLIENRADSLT